MPYRQISSRQVDIIRQLDIINLKLRGKDKAKEINIGVISIARHQHQRALLKINKIERSFIM